MAVAIIVGRGRDVFRIAATTIMIAGIQELTRYSITELFIRIILVNTLNITFFTFYTHIRICANIYLIIIWNMVVEVGDAVAVIIINIATNITDINTIFRIILYIATVIIHNMHGHCSIAIYYANHSR